MRANFCEGDRLKLQKSRTQDYGPHIIIGHATKTQWKGKPYEVSFIFLFKCHNDAPTFELIAVLKIVCINRFQMKLLLYTNMPQFNGESPLNHDSKKKMLTWKTF